MRTGDIFWAKDTVNNFHPIVFLKEINSDSFEACILSKEPTNGNILMNEKHFYNNDENGTLYTVRYRNSYLVVSRKFIKEKSWVKIDKVVGRLTEEGIRFVENKLSNSMIVKHYGPIWELT